jgi:hypothetical protein
VLKGQENNKITVHEVGTVKILAYKLPGETCPPSSRPVDVMGHSNFYIFVPLENHLQEADLQKTPMLSNL